MSTLADDGQSPKGDRFSEHDDYVSLLIMLREEFENLKAYNAQQDVRLARLEDTIKDLANDLNKLVTLVMSESNEEMTAEPIRKQPPPADQAHPHSFTEEVQVSWEYVIAQQGGYNHVFYITVRDLFTLPEDPIQFLAFLIQKRDTELKQQLEQLQAEYKKLKGSQLQQHFRELWESHYALLKKKQERTWKEEIFLEAFDAFITWLQD